MCCYPVSWGRAINICLMQFARGRGSNGLPYTRDFCTSKCKHKWSSEGTFTNNLLAKPPEGSGLYPVEGALLRALHTGDGASEPSCSAAKGHSRENCRIVKARESLERGRSLSSLGGDGSIGMESMGNPLCVFFCSLPFFAYWSSAPLAPPPTTTS